MERVRDSYDTVAERYADELADELEGKPLERALLRCFAELTAHVDGVVADVGCGPGHVTHHLADLGCDVIGIDLSPRMIDVARKRFPNQAFDVGSMLELPSDTKWAGAVALYSIIHLTPGQRRTALGELARAIRPEGVLLLGFHVSDEEYAAGKSKYLDEWWGERVDITAHFLDPAEVAAELAGAGFSITARVEREPQSGEYPSRRCYLIATR
ncbi:MAG TPA: methyltransferase domain-containing protein [Micromonosporaceae bacterium]|jgi:ubiquinone/menaquinone biosynthesis C-methylase UbiE